MLEGLRRTYDLTKGIARISKNELLYGKANKPVKKRKRVKVAR